MRISPALASFSGASAGRLALFVRLGDERFDEELDQEVLDDELREDDDELREEEDDDREDDEEEEERDELEEDVPE